MPRLSLGILIFALIWVGGIFASLDQRQAYDHLEVTTGIVQSFEWIAAPRIKGQATSEPTPVVTYHYFVGDTKYTGNHFLSLSGANPTQAEFDELGLSRTQHSKPLTVYYNRLEPSSSFLVLRRHIDPWLIALLSMIPLGFAVRIALRKRNEDGFWKAISGVISNAPKETKYFQLLLMIWLPISMLIAGLPVNAEVAISGGLYLALVLGIPLFGRFARNLGDQTDLETP